MLLSYNWNKKLGENCPKKSLLGIVRYKTKEFIGRIDFLFSTDKVV